MKEWYVCNLFFVFTRNKFERTGGFLPLFSRFLSESIKRCVPWLRENSYASLPLPSHITAPALPCTAPVHPQNCPCPPTSDYLLAVYLVSFSKPNERIMANKGKQGQVGYHRCRLDCRMKEFPTYQPTNGHNLWKTCFCAQKKIVKTRFRQERKQMDWERDLSVG